jgi:dolichol-phosphate mannosyltransferase
MAGPVSILLPTYNEAENLAPLLRALSEAIDRPLELIVIDDDSPDGTWRRVAEAASGDERIRLIRRIDERGLVSALRRGISAARGDVVMWLDCDFSHPPSLAPELLRALDDGADIAVASRYVPGGADRRRETLHRALSWSINTLAQLALGRGFRDYTSGYIAARRAIFERVRLQGDYGEYFISLICQARRLGYRVREVPFINYSRERGESKTATSAWGFARRGRKYLATIARLAIGRAEA